MTHQNITIDIDVSWDEDTHSRRVVEIIKTPRKLIYSENVNSKVSTSWETTLEIKPGDIVWVKSLAVIGNEHTDLIEINCEGEIYYVLRYEEFVVAKRGDEIICLNGYILVEPNRDDFNQYDNVFIPEINRENAEIESWTVKAVGSRNKNYKYGVKQDFEDELFVGQRICVSKKRTPYLLENSFHSQFDGDKKYYFVQRADIIYVYDFGL